MASISIIVPAFNQIEYCRQCISTVLTHTRGDYELILVDNGSTDGVGEFFDSVCDAVPGARAIHSPTNLGFAGGVNLGMAQATGHVVLLNSDTLVPEGWLERLENAMRQADDIGMVGPMSNYVSGPQLIEGLSLTSMDEINAYADGLAVENHGKLMDVARLVGFCVMIRDTVVREVGLFDERFGIGNFEDDDYGVRVMQAGYRLCIAQDCFVFHYGSRTFAGMGLVGDQGSEQLAGNQQAFFDKWGLDPSEAALSLYLSRRAEQLVSGGDLDQACRVLMQAVRQFPKNPANYTALACVLERMGQPEQAQEFTRRALRLTESSIPSIESIQSIQTSDP